MISIKYELENAGWASVTIGNGTTRERFGVSYLHDSLKELAVSAISIKEKTDESVIFMEEPGEIKLLLKRSQETKLNFELRWYKDWASWDIISENDYQVIMTGETTIPSYFNQVRNILIKIHDEIGPDLYKEKWIEHEFPITEYEKLK
ncbi:hypothetical protein [Aquimarina sp. 2201CG5-10]|uniref:hypothetical protein n=1 Tax=Aquimarina callyspongiae TaxID=3098150 RepID=UPI002AB59F3C|nr:hypothetical protein [Aquimarina sp. 2201CG5-10]MDY8137458.1 hypothetical protein [Aquimarina sp. 2201CG5-10]